MRKSLVVVSICVVLYTGCASAPDRPDWVLNPPRTEDLIYGMGVAQNTNESMAWQAATNRARQDLANQITASVEETRADYGKGSTEFYKNSSTQMTSVVLRGALVNRRDVASKHRYYVLVSYSKADMRQAFAALAREEAARNPAFQAEEALRSMDAQLAKSRSGSVRDYD